MTLDECYAANQGKALLIPGGGAGNEGQCVQWADTVLHDVYGFDYHWGNAIDWWNNPGELLNHFDQITDGSIKKGDFVIFNTQVGSVYGHIDVAMQDGTTGNFLGADSNWGGNKTVHMVQHSNAGYVLGSLRLKGESQGENMIQDKGSAQIVYEATTHSVPSDEAANSIVGLEYRDTLAKIQTDSVWKYQDGILNVHMPAVLAQLNISDPAQAASAISKLQAGGSGLDASTKAEIDNTNSMVQWIKDKLTSVFK